MHPGVHAATHPDKPAYRMARSGQTVTYRALDEGSNRLARLLWQRGLRPGDTFALCMENNSAYLEVTWAGHRSGLYYTAASSRLTVGELAYIVEDCEAKALVMSYEKRDLAAELLPHIGHVDTRLMLGGTIEGFESYEEAVGAMPAEPLERQLEGRDMLYSSGTTGRPKGVRHKLSGNPVDTPTSVTVLGQMLYGFEPDMVYLSPAPMYHAAPLRFTMAVTQVGGTAVIMEHFDPEEFLALIQEHRVTHTQVVPTMFVRLLKLPKDVRDRYDVSSLRYVVHAAAPCPVPVKEQIIEWFGPVVHEYYAATEGNGFVCCNSEEWLAHRGTVGKALVATIHITDEDGNELPAGEAGTIWFEGGAEFEYHNDPEKTKASRNEKGWSTLGDVGYLDEDGYLYLTDRKAYMIISGGVNIYPQEAENVLLTHPKVLDAAVFGVPHEEMGERVHAVVQPLDMAEAGTQLAQELMSYCRSQLAHYKCPTSVDFEAELPRHPTGKLYKRLLKDRYWAGHETRI
ncbi:MAG TPA: AMP-binding protein [Acidimicrobiales bacterium]|nr:AMP-binding protein [Acidimicrobiales bacterium]